LLDPELTARSVCAAKAGTICAAAVDDWGLPRAAALPKGGGLIDERQLVRRAGLTSSGAGAAQKSDGWSFSPAAHGADSASVSGWQSPAIAVISR
jgi:hypothetical protein